MRVEQRDGRTERKIVTSMIVDKDVLARIAPKWNKDGLFNSRWSNIVAKWCVQYFNKYGEAPQKAIEGLYDSWASNGADKESSNLVGKFLDSLSGEYEQLAEGLNKDYVVDLAAEHFNRVKLQKLSETIQEEIGRGKPELALKRVQSFDRVELGTGSTINVLQNRESIIRAFESKHEPLITYPGPLGKFFGDALERDAFVSFMAPDKTGKSYWLGDIAWRGMLQRRKVALFEVGDMSEGQIMRRFMCRVAARPLKKTPQNKPILYPTKIDHDPDETYATVETEERTFDHDLDWRAALKACDRVMLKKVKSKDPLLRLSCHPNSTINVPGIQSIIQNWEREGWVPDIIVIDYADILAPIAHTQETRDQINMTWKALRALSQSLHCLVVTATQSNAAAYSTETITRKHFSDDKRKLAHVTGMVGINQSQEEKDHDITRLNWIVLREAEYSTSRCIHVAGCRPLGQIAVRSTY